MNDKEFIALLESLFGEYKLMYKTAVLQEVCKLTAEQKIVALQKLKQTYKNEYGVPPSIPTILEAAGILQNDMQEAQAEWLTICKVSDMISVLIVNKKTQAVIESFGGWYKFCQYRDNKPEYAYKDFINRYINTKCWFNEHKILRGYNDMYWNNDIDYAKVMIIGDKEEGTEILEDLKNGYNTIEQFTTKLIKGVE